MKPSERRTLDARDKAEKAFTQSAQRDAAFIKERDRIRTVNDEKTQRLRTLRLAKEAVDREAAATLTTEKAAEKAPRKARAKASVQDAPKPEVA